jgi:hypothetical protein
MSVQTNGDPGQAPATGTPGQGQAPAGSQDQQAQQQGQAPADGSQAGTPDTFAPDTPLEQFPEAIRGYIGALRQEAAAHRTKAQEAQQQVQQFQRQNETEQERVAREQQEAQQEREALQAERDSLAQQVRDMRVGGTVRQAATTAQAFDPDLVWTLVQGEVQTDADGNPTNVDDLLNTLREGKPYLFRRTPNGADGGAGGGQGVPASTDVNAMIRTGSRPRVR